MPTVKDCCCGCTLRTGTLILLILSVIGGLFQLASVFTLASQKNVESSDVILSTVRGLIGLVAAIIGIYGVNAKKSSCLIPFLVIQVLGMVYLLVIMLALLFIGTAAISMAPPNTSSQNKSDAFGMIFVIEMMLLISEALCYYTFVVMLSYYKKLKEKIVL